MSEQAAPATLVAADALPSDVRLGGVPGRAGRAGRVGALLAWPAFVLGVFFAIPFALLVRVSLAPHDGTALWLGGISLAPLAALADPVLLRSLAISLGLALVVGALSVALGFPLAWLITGMPRRRQVAWLILLLATLSLSEVLIVFSWQVMLSKRIGLSAVLVAVGLMDEPDGLAPGLGAVVACLLYLIVPFVVLTLYPPLSRLDRGLVEAARTLGASGRQAFLTVVLPLVRGPLASAFALAAVLTLGSYVTPVVLGLAQHWTVAVLISKAALGAQDLPAASAMALLLLAVSVLLLAGLTRLGRGRVARLGTAAS